MAHTLLTRDEIQAAFAQVLPRIRLTAGYRARLLLVLFGLGLLQVLYLALIAAVMWLTALYCIAALSFELQLNFFSLMVYIGPPAVGLITLMFLFKPILIRPPRPPGPVQLSRPEEPILFEFLDTLCARLGAPRPSRVYVDLQVNAFAAVRGWRGFFLGDLSLTIGLPLAADFTLAQFAGVLGHEFGHFAQRAGLRSYYLMRTIQNWFARVVYQRDSWDSWLESHREGGDYRVRIVAVVAAAVVAASRFYLKLLMHAGNWIASGFSRHMEFDADRYEAALAGADVFEATALRLPVLGCGAALAWRDAEKDWSLGRLPEDIASLVAARTALLPAESAEQIVASEMAAKTGRWDTHPSTAERIASVRRAAWAGVLRIEGPAARLFNDLPGLCRRATWHHYEKVLGLSPDRAHLVTSEEVVGHALAANQYDHAAHQLLGLPVADCSEWLHLPCGAAGDFEPRPDLAEFREAMQTSMLHYTALVIRETGVQLKPESFRLDSADPVRIRESEAESRRALRQAAGALNASIRPAALRIERAAAEALEVRAAWQSYCVLAASFSELRQIRWRAAASQIVRQNSQVFPAAACANLLDRLQDESLACMDSVLARAADAAAEVIFDPVAGATLRAQLTTTGSRPERIAQFLSRAEVTGARSLARLACFAASTA